jgi:hypothetical protein
LRFGELGAVLSSISGNDGTALPSITVLSAGHAPFVTAIANQGIDTTTFSRAKIIQLDPSTPTQQVVASFYTGGAHCCTITHIITQQSSGSWIVVDAGSVDGEGYEFEDVDGDGSVELLSVDNSFLYTFGAYSESYAPPLVFRLSGGSVRDVTRDSVIHPYIERELRQMEGAAAKDPTLWNKQRLSGGLGRDEGPSWGRRGGMV